MTRLVLLALLASACDGGSTPIDAGLDAPRRLALGVDGPAPLQSTTRSLKVTISSNGTTRMDTFVVAGLPTTVDVPAPIQLSTWSIVVDGFDGSGQQIGRGTKDVPSGTLETTVLLSATN